MKNPHGVEPTRYMKREESRYAIYCNSGRGPIFGTENKCWDTDIFICNNCNEENNCFIYNNGAYGYECNTEYKSSLFVNTAGPNEDNNFSVLDYEVYCIDYENRENINKLCKHSDIICEYIETKDISEESLKQFADDTELLNDLDAINCKDSSIRLKISQLCLRNPSKLLSDTWIVNQHYDSYLREWLGNDCKWKLIYRSSENGYTAKSFHRYCNYIQGPNLIVIKSSGGWIFGGYTTQSWSGNSIYYDMIY